jgi:hypothetical protein
VPVRAIVERIRQTSQLQFVLVDAAQAFCHVPIDDCLAVADFVVTGCHKWMRAGQPMGIGLYGRRSTQRLINNTLQHISNTGGELDPLLQFTEQLDGGRLTGLSETVNLTPLFSCSAAAVTHTENAQFFEAGQHNVHADCDLSVPIELDHWHPVQPHQTLRSRITLFANMQRPPGPDPAEHARREWLSHGCVVTAYANGWVRVSPPQELLTTSMVASRFTGTRRVVEAIR